MLADKRPSKHCSMSDIVIDCAGIESAFEECLFRFLVPNLCAPDMPAGKGKAPYSSISTVDGSLFNEALEKVSGTTDVLNSPRMMF